MKTATLLSRFLKGLRSSANSHPKQLTTRRKRRRSIAGFTMIELLVVIAIAAVMAAILAPSWLSFVNNQRISQVNQQVYSLLQDTQRQAKRTKTTYNVSFRTRTATIDGRSQVVAEYTVHPETTHPSNIADQYWRRLGEEQSIRPGQFYFYTNLAVNNTPTTPVENRVATSLTTNNYPQPTASSQGPVTISFDSQGILDPLAQPRLTMGTPPASRDGLIIGVGVPNNVNPTPTAPIERTLRCVTVKTLLGSMELQQGELCRPWV